MRVALAHALMLTIGAVPPASAHHSLAVYDGDGVETIVGTVAAYQWQNPHVLLRLRPAGAEPGAPVFVFEGGDINRLMRLGWTSDAVRAGDIVMVTYNPLRDGAHGGHLVELATARGETFSLLRYRYQGDPPPAPENAPGPTSTTSAR